MNQKKSVEEKLSTFRFLLFSPCESFIGREHESAQNSTKLNVMIFFVRSADVYFNITDHTFLNFNVFRVRIIISLNFVVRSRLARSAIHFNSCRLFITSISLFISHEHEKSELSLAT